MQNTKDGRYITTNRIVHLPANEVLPNPTQPRRQFDQEALRELAASIMRYGVLQPLTVRKRGRGYELVSGERRLRAAKMAGLKTVPCVVLDVNTSESASMSLVENIHRRDLDFIEEAEAIEKLIRVFGLSQDEAARRIGRSQSAVANKLRILKLPGDMLYVIRQTGLTERHARALLRLGDNEAREKALSEIVKKRLNVAKTEEYIDSLLAGEKKKPVIVLSDVRLFLNSVPRGMDVMKRSGIAAESSRKETEKDIVLTIRIPKERAVN